MNIHAKKTQENKSQSTANEVAQEQSIMEPAIQFVDNRPEVIAQRKLQTMANNSSRINQLKTFQEMANNNPSAKQTAQLQAMSDNFTNHTALNMNSVQATSMAGTNAQVQLKPMVSIWSVDKSNHAAVKVLLGNKNLADAEELSKENLQKLVDILEKDPKYPGFKKQDFEDLKNLLPKEPVIKEDPFKIWEAEEKKKHADKIEVSGGWFHTEGFKVVNDMEGFGAEMGELQFFPNPLLDATEVHLVQTVKDTIEDQEAYAKVHQGNVGFANLRVPGGEHQGVGIDMEHHAPAEGNLIKILDARKDHPDKHDDRLRDRKLKLKGQLSSVDPRYSQQRLSEEIKPYAPSDPPKSEHTGYATVRPSTKLRTPWKPPCAVLRDRPYTPKNAGVSGMEFEVVALAEGGEAGSQYVGSVTWGWKLVENKPEIWFKRLGDAPSAAFIAAAEHWNTLKLTDEEGKDHEVMKLPIPK